MADLSKIKNELQAALGTRDWLLAVECADAWLDAEPDNIDVRHLLAQLHLRVNGSRLAAGNLREALERSVKQGQLWKALAAQKWLEGVEPHKIPARAYAKIFARIFGQMSAGRPGRLMSLVERMSPESFEEFGAALQSIGLANESRWSSPGVGAAAVLVAWGGLDVQWEGQLSEAREGDLIRIPSPEVSFVARCESALLYLPPDAFECVAALSPSPLELALAPGEQRREPELSLIVGGGPEAVGSPEEAAALREAYEGEMGEEGQELREMWFSIRESRR